MNKLKPELQVTVLNALVEGASIRSVERMTGVHRDTITRLLVRVGERCETILDETMRDLSCKRLEVDELPPCAPSILPAIRLKLGHYPLINYDGICRRPPAPSLKCGSSSLRCC